MIAAAAAHAVHHLLSQAAKPQQPSPFTLPTDQGTAGTSSSSTLGAIGGDVGKLSSDLLSMLGVGSGSDASSAQQGAKSYLQANALGR